VDRRTATMLCARPSHICAAQMMVELRGSKAASTKIDLLRVSLELRFETDCIAARGRNGVTGEQSRKVYEIEPIVDVLNVELHPHSKGVFFPDIRSDGSIQRERRLNSAALEINAIDHLLTVLRERLFVRAVEIDRQAAPIFSAKCSPEPRQELVAEARPHRVTLVLRDPETPGQIGQCIRRRLPQKEASGYREIGRAHHVGCLLYTSDAA